MSSKFLLTELFHFTCIIFKITFIFVAGNLFGVSLSTLLLRDSQLTNEESNIPLVFQKVLNELSKRGVKEEGILRVGGHKQKVCMYVYKHSFYLVFILLLYR